jgi:hypothetical protein
MPLRDRSVRRSYDLYTFQVLPRRAVERAFARISQNRRCIREDERLIARHEGVILWATVALMTDRLT